MQLTRMIAVCVLTLVLTQPTLGAETGLPVAAGRIPTEHLQLWLRADWGVEAANDGISVGMWRDQSGKGNHALAAADSPPRVLLNAAGTLSGIHFDTESFLRVPHHDDLNAGHALTFFAVYRNGSGNRIVQKKSNGTVTEDSWFVISTHGLGVAGAYRNESPTLFPGGRDTIYIVSHVFNAETGKINMYSDGEHVWTIDGVKPQLPNSDDLFIGKRDNPTGNEASWQGDLFEMMVFNIALDNRTRESVEEYLLHKYRGTEPKEHMQERRFVPAKSAEAQWWSQWGGVYPFIQTGSQDTLGPLALPGIQTQPVGSAHVFGSEQADIFAKVNGKPAPGLYVIPWIATSDEGVPVFGTPVAVNVPTNHPVIANGSISQVGTEIHAMWIEGSRLVHGVFDVLTFSITSVEEVPLPRLPSSAQKVHFVVLADGRVDVFFELGDGTPWYPPGQDRASENFSPYDGAGIWQGGPRYRSLYAATYPGLLTGEPSATRLFTPTTEASRFDMGKITNASVSSLEHAGDIVVGSRFGPIYYYAATDGVNGPIETLSRNHFVDLDGNMLRHPTINASPISYPNAVTGYSDFIVGGEGALYYYRFTGQISDAGNPIFADPVPVLQKDSDLYGGSLPVPTVVDWNGDGVLDIVAGNSEGRVLFFQNVGTNDAPAFMPGEPVKAGDREIHIQPGYRGSIQGLPESRWGYSAPNVVDWNGDGLLDIVMGDATGGYTVYLNRGTRNEPRLDVARPLYHDGIELTGHWRVRPAVARFDGKTALIIVDGDGHFHLYWRLDDYNVADAGKLRLDDGSLISATQELSGQTGRVKLELADWDGDGALDLVVGTGRPSSVPNGETGFPLPIMSSYRASLVLFLKNVGDNDAPVFKHPVPFMFQGDPLIPSGTHSVSPAVTSLGGGDGLNLLVSNEAGRFILYRNEDLSLYDEPIVNIRYPTSKEVIKGELSPEIDIVSPVSELKQVQVTIGGQVVYQGEKLPRNLKIDSTQFRSGPYNLNVIAENMRRKRMTDFVTITIDNSWSIVDEFLPPIASGFFGSLDRSKTELTSEGWDYDESPFPYEDDSRRVRKSDTDEYLVWQTHNLEEFTITVFATEPSLRNVKTSISSDQQEWVETPHEVTVESHRDGWYRLRVSGRIESPASARWLRVDLQQSGLDPKATQFGSIELVGDSGKAIDG